MCSAHQQSGIKWKYYLNYLKKFWLSFDLKDTAASLFFSAARSIVDDIHTLTTPYEYVSQVSDTGRLWMTSGAIQGNVPTRDMWVVWEWNLEAPKSQIWGHGQFN